jgi:transcriptional regulator with XRE-family HTH domain
MDSGDWEAGMLRRLDLAQQAAKLNDVDVATELGITPQLWRRIKAGKSNPSIPQFARACMLFGVLPSYICFGRCDLPAVALAAIKAACGGGQQK